MAVLELEGRAAAGEREQLEAEADPERRERAGARPVQLLDRRPELRRVARSVADEKPRDGSAVPSFRDLVVVREPQHRDAPDKKCANDARLDTAVEERDERALPRPVEDRLGDRDLRDQRLVGVGRGLGEAPRELLRARPSVRRADVEDPPEHPMRPDVLGEAAGVDPEMPGTPSSSSQRSSDRSFCQWLGRVVEPDDDPADLDVGVLQELGESERVAGVRARHAVVPQQREGEREDLAPIGRVGQRLGIPDHAGREDDLPGVRGGPSEAPALEPGPVLQVEGPGQFGWRWVRRHVPVGTQRDRGNVSGLTLV